MITLLNKAIYTRPETDFTGNIDHLEANLFTLVKFNATFEIQTAARASDGSVIVVADTEQNTNDYLTQSGGFTEFQQGELVEVVSQLEDISGNLLLPTGTYLIDIKLDDNTVRLADSVGAPLTLVTGVPIYGEIRQGDAVNGFLALQQEPHAARFSYGLIGNDEGINFLSKVDGQELDSVIDSGAALPIVFTGMVDKYKASAKTGTLQIRKTFSDNVNKIWRYEVEQTFRVNPYYLLGQIGQYQNGEEVSLFAEQHSLRHVYRLRLYQKNSGSGVYQESEVLFDKVTGNVGARNENYNSLEPQYLLQSLNYNNTIGQLTKDGTNSLTIEISEVSNVAGWVELYFILLPEQDEDFKNNTTLMDDNYAFDSVVIQVGGGVVNGTRVLQNCSATTALGVVTVDAEILFDATTKAMIEGYANKNYIIKANVYSAGQTAGNTDETIVDVDFNNIGFEIPAGTIDTETSLLYHDINTVEDGNTSPAHIFANDEVVMNTLIYLDSDTFSDITLEKVTAQLIATDGSATAILQALDFDVSAAQLVGGARLVDETVATGLNVRSDELKAKYRLYREPNLDTGTIYAYRLLYPFIYRWEYWERLVTDTLVSAFFDTAERFNGYNNNWNRLADIGSFEIKYRVIVEAKVQGGNLTSFTEDFDFESYNYDEGQGTCVTELFDDLTPLIYSGKPYIKDGIFTKIVSTWTFPSAVTAAKYWHYFHIGKFENNTFKSIASLSSQYNREDISYLSSNGGAGFVVLANDGANVITATAYVNPDKFRSDANEYTIYSRINTKGVPISIIFQTTNVFATDGTFDPQIFNTDGGFEIDYGNGDTDTIVGNNVNYSGYVNAGVKTVSCLFASAQSITEINASNDELVNTLDLSKLTNLGGDILLRDNTGLTSLLLPNTNELITNFWLDNCNLTGILDASGLNRLGGDVRLDNNSNLTQVIFPISPVPMRIFSPNTDLTGNLDLSTVILSGILRVGNNPNLTNITHQSSNEPITEYTATGCNLTGTLDVSGLTDLGGAFQLSGNGNLTQVINPTSSRVFTQYRLDACNLTGTLDASGLTGLGGVFQLNNNGNLTQVINPISSRVFTLYRLDNCNLTGTLDASGLTGLGGDVRLDNNSNLTQVIFPISPVPMRIFSPNTDLTGTMDLSGLTGLAGIVRFDNNSNLTEIILPNSTQTLLLFQVPNCNLTNGIPTLPNMSNCINVDNAGYSFDNNNMTQAGVDQILVDLDNIAVAGFTGRAIIIAGTNAAPSAVGLAAVFSLTTKGITVTTS